MSAPWEQYQAGDATAVADDPPAESGPWSKYKSATAAGPWQKYQKSKPTVDLVAVKRNAAIEAQTIDASRMQGKDSYREYAERHPTDTELTIQKLLPLAKTPEQQSLLGKYIANRLAPELAAPGTAGQAWQTVWSAPKPTAEYVETQRGIRQSELDTTQKLRAQAKAHGWADDKIDKIYPMPALAARLGEGAFDAVEDLALTFQSPGGALTLGIGSLPKSAQRMVSLAFAGQMLSQAPDQASGILDEIRKPEAERDYAKIARLSVGAAASVGLGTAALAHGAGGSRAQAASEPSPVKTATVETSQPATPPAAPASPVVLPSADEIKAAMTQRQIVPEAGAAAAPPPAKPAAKEPTVVKLYHGTTKEFPDADITTGKKMFGIHLTTDAAAAKDYGPNVKAYQLAPGARTLDLSDGGDLWQFMQQHGIVDKEQAADPDLERYVTGGQLFQYDLSSKTHLADTVAQTAKAQGYDMVKMPDDLGGKGDNTAHVVLNPKVLRPEPAPAPAAEAAANPPPPAQAETTAAVKQEAGKPSEDLPLPGDFLDLIWDKGAAGEEMPSRDAVEEHLGAELTDKEWDAIQNHHKNGRKFQVEETLNLLPDEQRGMAEEIAGKYQRGETLTADERKWFEGFHNLTKVPKEKLQEMGLLDANGKLKNTGKTPPPPSEVAKEPYPNTGVGSPADEYGAIYGPKLAPEQISKFGEQVGQAFPLESPPGTTVTLKVKPNICFGWKPTSPNRPEV